MTTADEQGVEVKDGRTPNRTHFYKGAAQIAVIEGHLHVRRGSGDIVAIHAPGEWHRAEVKP